MSVLFLDSESRNELDLTEVGSHRYCAHPSAEAILLAYAYGDDLVKVWEPLDEPMPADLRAGLEDDFQMIVAWNGPGFDRLLFKAKLGIDIPVERWIDPMVQSRYCSLPGSQEKVANILDVSTKKLIEHTSNGLSVIDFFCSPLRLGGYETLFGIEPTQWRDKTTHPKEWQQLINRVITDVEGMREIYYRLSKFPLPDHEWELFAVNEEINDRGIYTDSVLLHGAAFVGDKEQESLKKEFLELTGIAKPKSPKAVLRFLREHGYTFSSVNKQFKNRALNGECDMDAVGRRALELHGKLAKSSLSKLDAIKESVQEDGRVRGLFNFMGAARTHRFSSGLIQLQNLIKPSKEVEKKYDRALELLRRAEYDLIKKEFKSPTDVASAAVRPIFRASPGNKLLIADLAAIEVRGAAWLSGCTALSQLFRDHEMDCGFPDDDEHRCCNGRDPYITFASLMDPSKTYEELYADFKRGNKVTRTNAKPPMLGCFGENTLIITDNGVKRIVEVSTRDKLWDGVNWVSHDGCVYRGAKEVIDFNGVKVTPDHEIFISEGESKSVWDLSQNIRLEKQAFSLAFGLLKKAKYGAVGLIDENFIISVLVLFATKKDGYFDTISNLEKQQSATSVQKGWRSRHVTESTIDSPLGPLEKLSTGLRTDIMRYCRDAEEKELRLTGTREEEFLAYSKMYTNLWTIVSDYPIATGKSTRLIEKTITGTTKKEIYVSLPERRITAIRSVCDTSSLTAGSWPQSSSGNNIARNIEIWEPSPEKSGKESLRSKLSSSKKTVVVSTFDIANAGPNHRFMILTEQGPLLVHNCGYGLAAGERSRDEEGNMVATGLLAYADSMNIDLDIEYAEQAVQVYRNAYEEIPDFWYDLHRAFVNAVENEAIIEVGPLTLEMKGKVLCMWMPSGSALHYINPTIIWEDAVSKKGNPYKRSVIYVDGIDQKTHQWTQIPTRGAKLFENAVQKICRDILGCGLIEASRRGLPVVLHCHDEIVAEVPENGNYEVEDLVDCMTQPISWAKGFLIAAEGFESEVYRKG